jgi:hypothetical protein
MASKITNQRTGNYNVFCQSCGRVIATNIETHQKALKLEENHSGETECRFTGTHKIKD